MLSLIDRIENSSPIMMLVFGIVIGVVVSSVVFFGLLGGRGGETGTSIEVKDLRISSLRIGKGQRTSLVVDVINSGRSAETRTLKLRVDGDVRSSKDVTLASGENGHVSFSVSGENVGDHTLKVGGLTRTFEVLEYGIFSSQDYGFVLKYPNEWVLRERQSPTGLMVSLRENSTGGLTPRAQAQVSVRSISQRTPPLENRRDTYLNEAENNENLKWISEPEIKRTENLDELNLKAITTTARGDIIVRLRTIRGENYQYNVQGISYENNYETYKEDLNLIVENFDLRR